MKLSEAMMLASTMGEVPTNDSWDCCLLGISCHAVGRKNVGNLEASARWPWIDGLVTIPQGEYWYSGRNLMGSDFVTMMCSYVENGRMTIQQAAAQVAAVEPQDIQNEQMDGGQVTHPTELSRSDEVQNIDV